MREKLLISDIMKPFNNIVFEIIVSVKLFLRSMTSLIQYLNCLHNCACTSCIVKPRALNEKILPSTSLWNVVRNHKERSDNELVKTSTYMSILFYRINYIQEMWLMNWWRINKLLIFFPDFQISLRDPLKEWHDSKVLYF